VLYDGIANRADTLTLDSDPWLLPPGETDMELTADAGSGSITFLNHDAYWS